eukprot:gene8458-5934_t
MHNTLLFPTPVSMGWTSGLIGNPIAIRFAYGGAAVTWKEASPPLRWTTMKKYLHCSPHFLCSQHIPVTQNSNDPLSSFFSFLSLLLPSQTQKMPSEEQAAWLEVMLDRAIASYEAHRDALQMVSTELCRAKESDDAVCLPGPERRRLLAAIDNVLHHHALRFSPVHDAPSRSSTPSRGSGALIQQPPVTVEAGRSEEAPRHASPSDVSSIHSSHPTYEEREKPPPPPPPQRAPPPPSSPPRRSHSAKTGVPLSSWPLPDDAGAEPRHADSPTLAEQYRRRSSRSSSRLGSRRADEQSDRSVESSALPGASQHTDPIRGGPRYQRRERPQSRATPPPLEKEKVCARDTSYSGTQRPALERSREWAKASAGVREVRDWQRDYSKEGWDGEPREKVEPRPLRTATPRRGTGKPTASPEMERALFDGGLKAQLRHPNVVQNSPAAERYMQAEDADLRQRKAASDQRLRDMAPKAPERTPGPAADTAIENQLRREQGALESQLLRMEMERDFLLGRRPEDTGSEPRYAQLNHRIGKVTEDLKRVDRELRTLNQYTSMSKRSVLCLPDLLVLYPTTSFTLLFSLLYSSAASHVVLVHRRCFSSPVPHPNQQTILSLSAPQMTRDPSILHPGEGPPVSLLATSTSTLGGRPLNPVHFFFVCTIDEQVLPQVPPLQCCSRTPSTGSATPAVLCSPRDARLGTTSGTELTAPPATRPKRQNPPHQLPPLKRGRQGKELSGLPQCKQLQHFNAKGCQGSEYMDSLIAKIPAAWVPHIRPFLQRAEEFQQKDPVVSYFLRTHAVHVGAKRRSKDDQEGVHFLNTLLDELGREKAALGARLQGVDGRTALTKTALALFRRADEEEQAGQCNLSLVRLFFTAAVLFEATAQFTKDGSMDPIAAERCRYAKYTASRMKKAIDSGALYTRADHPEGGSPSRPTPPDQMAGAGEGEGRRQTDVPRQKKSSVTINDSRPQMHQPPKQSPPPPQPKPAPASDAPEPEDRAGRVTMDDIFAAQKHAKQAVSALQFLDHKQAVAELRAALALLEKGD